MPAAPWVIADADVFVNDTVVYVAELPPHPVANAWYLMPSTSTKTLPFAVTGAAMVGIVAVAAYAVWRRRPDVAEVLRWLALVLAVANLVNKQGPTTSSAGRGPRGSILGTADR